MTNYRKRIERIYLEDDLHTEPDDIFWHFPLEEYMKNKYHAVKDSELW